eukprot:3884738-Prymnesium_polylepis.1
MPHEELWGGALKLLLYDDSAARDGRGADEQHDLNDDDVDDFLGEVELPLSPFFGGALPHSHGERHT